jgi:hypothetical protein
MARRSEVLSRNRAVHGLADQIEAIDHPIIIRPESWRSCCGYHAVTFTSWRNLSSRAFTWVRACALIHAPSLSSYGMRHKPGKATYERLGAGTVDVQWD